MPLSTRSPHPDNADEPAREAPAADEAAPDVTAPAAPGHPGDEAAPEDPAAEAASGGAVSEDEADPDAPENGSEATGDEADPGETPSDGGEATGDEADPDQAPAAEAASGETVSGGAVSGDEADPGEAPADGGEATEHPADPSKAPEDEADPDKAPADGGEVADGPRRWRVRHPRVARGVTWGVSALAAVFVFGALLVPNELPRITPAAFARIPAEGVLGLAVVLLLPPRVGRVFAVVAGVGLGLVTVLNLLDIGFYMSLDRSFDPVLDWILFDDAQSFLKDSIGGAGATVAVIGVVLLVVALLVLVTLSVVRLSNLAARNGNRATRTVLVLVTAWLTCAALGVQIANIPVASESTAQLIKLRAHRVKAGIEDERKFAELAAVDAYRDTPDDQLLTGLRGKNVVFAFIESYGRSAIEDPEMAPQVNATLADSTSRLRAAGFSSQSGFLRSPTAGGGSWLAHSTFMSGLWVTNQQRYRSVTSSNRLTLTGAFRRADAWRTVGIMPGVTKSWPEGRFYGLDHVYDSDHLGYEGPKFSWAPVPDQYSLAAFERLEHGKEDHQPLMAEIILVSSHNPWAPLPRMIGWDEVGDGSVYKDISKEGKDPKEVWKDPHQVRKEYARSVQYSVNSLVTWAEKYGDKDTVLVFLGDHQPVPTVVGAHASRDVPIAVVAQDPAVMQRISGWGWHDGLKPGPKAPVWRMDTFRDRFLKAYGPQPAPAPKAPAASAPPATKTPPPKAP